MKNSKGLIDDSSKIYYLHTSKFAEVKAGTARPATIALQLIDGKVHYGVALCGGRDKVTGKMDNFCRETGRNIAYDRLNNDFAILPVSKTLFATMSEEEICLHILRHIAMSVTTNPARWNNKLRNFKSIKNSIIETSNVNYRQVVA